MIFIKPKEYYPSSNKENKADYYVNFSKKTSQTLKKHGRAFVKSLISQINPVLYPLNLGIKIKLTMGMSLWLNHLMIFLSI